MKIKNVSELNELFRTKSEEFSKSKRMISVCCGTGCRACASVEVTDEFKRLVKENGLEEEIAIKQTGCHGFCEKGPLVVIYPEKIFYIAVKPEDAAEIFSETIQNGSVVDRLLYSDPLTGEKVVSEHDVTFYNRQNRMIFGKNGLINPEEIYDYIALGGYTALGKALTSMTGEKIISEVKKSGLRGRGGAGFPTGVKWEMCAASKSDVKYLICNGDEGDPGAFMDRSILEGNPHSVIEGMVIGAFAVGASKGYIYVREEYPLAVKHLIAAIQEANNHGLLGENILGTGFSFSLEIFQGAGAFVCGEETGLIASIEGRTGRPRPRPPYPAQKGLWGKPTNINNVKTWANIPLIINNGADNFAKTGTESSKGTMIFSLVGKINNTGLIEVPMGITLREIIFEIGGGIPGGKKFKAIQTGGPSGGCIPVDKLDMRIDFDELKKAGSMMGSGGLIVMDEDTCMVDVAKYFLTFTREESCGKCTPCRVGTQAMLDILTRICEGKGEPADISKLKKLAVTIRDGSLCALGGTAPNPVLTTLDYFLDEYRAHIEDKRCPALACKELLTYTIDPEKCKACGLCKKACGFGAIEGEPKIIHKVIQEKCVKCGACYEACPKKFGAVLKTSGSKENRGV